MLIKSSACSKPRKDRDPGAPSKMIARVLLGVGAARDRCFSCSSRHAGKSKIPSVSFGQTTHFCPNCRFACRYETLLPLYVDVDYVIDRVNGKEESPSPKDKASNMFHTVSNLVPETSNNLTSSQWLSDIAFLSLQCRAACIHFNSE